MNKIVLGGDMIEIDIDSNVLVSDECDTIEINESARVEAIGEMEEEFDEIVEFNEFF
tara:strand:- start:44 stop:214 length:171 start_codon:yes stop_codon:yes gene_type:complete